MDPLTDRLKRHVYALAGDIGERNVFLPDALRAAENYIAAEWKAQGYRVARQVHLMDRIECANLEVVRPGRRAAAEILVIGAHYDSVFGSPGADDNASGIAGLLELSRLFLDLEPQLGVHFVAFTNEEPPFFGGRHMGSHIYAKAARRRGERIRFMVSLEMLGFYCDAPGSQKYPPLLGAFYPDRGNFIAVVSNWRSRPCLQQLLRSFRAGSPFPVAGLAAPILVPGIAASDHFSFWRQGYPALMVTDTAYYRNPWYHTAGDLPERLNYEAFAAMVEGLGAALADCAAAG